MQIFEANKHYAIIFIPNIVSILSCYTLTTKKKTQIGYAERNQYNGII